MKIEIRVVCEPYGYRECYYILPAGYVVEGKSFEQIYYDSLYYSWNRDEAEKKILDMKKGGKYE